MAGMLQEKTARPSLCIASVLGGLAPPLPVMWHGSLFDRSTSRWMMPYGLQTLQGRYPALIASSLVLNSAVHALQL
jgi:hypothetical protein